MAEDIVIPFGSAPPAEGRLTDRIPPGPYVLRTGQATLETASSGAPMIVVPIQVSRGGLKGKRLIDRFVIPKDASASLFPVQRLNSLVRAVRGKEATKNSKAGPVLQAISDKEFIADVEDEESEWNGRKIVNSRIISFFHPQSDGGKERVEQIVAAQRDGRPSAAQPTSEPAPAEPKDELGIEEPPAEAPAEPAAVGNDDLEDLFD